MEGSQQTRPRLAPNRSQSYAPPHNNNTERTPLLRTSSNQSPGDPHSRKWLVGVKRKSAALSDLLSGHTHSSFTLPLPVEGDESSDNSGEEDGAGSLRHKSSIVGGYDGEFRADLEGAGGQGVRIW